MNYLRGAALAVALYSLSSPALQAQEDAAASPSVIAPLAAKSLLLDLAWAGERAVAVGERGHVLVSDDQGATWTQVPVPASANLTAVYFVDEMHGWAVGHDELILRTEDGGSLWERVHLDTEANRPLLDVWFADAERGLAVGAYGALYASADGGRSWSAMPFEPMPLGGPVTEPDPDDYDAEVDMGFDFHLNAIAAGPGETLYLAAEAGRLFRSDDSGATWRELPSPYDGSFYGVLPLESGALLAYGLRGNMFRSEDGGENWTEVATGAITLLSTGIQAGPDTIVLVGLAGVILVSRDEGRSFSLSQQDDRKGLSSLLWVGDDTIIVAGEGGVRRLDLPGSR